MPTVMLSPSGRSTIDLALADDRLLVLADLIALRQIGIEIVLPVEHRLQIDLRLQPEPGAHRLAHAFGVDHRQHAGHRGVDQRDMRIRRAAEFGRGAGEQLGVRRDLGMDLHADHDLPVAGRALDQFRFLRSVHDLDFAVEISRAPPRGTDGTTAPHRRVGSEDISGARRWLTTTAPKALASGSFSAEFSSVAAPVFILDRAANRRRQGSQQRRRPAADRFTDRRAK